MQSIPIRTTVVGSYPFPGWLEFASQNLGQFGKADIEEIRARLYEIVEADHPMSVGQVFY